MGDILTVILDASWLKCKMEDRRTLNEKTENSACKAAVSSVALNIAAGRKVWITEETNIFLFHPSNNAIIWEPSVSEFVKLCFEFLTQFFSYKSLSVHLPTK